MLDRLMFRKVELWVVALLLLLWLVATVFFGYAVWYNSQGHRPVPVFSAMVEIAKFPRLTIKAGKALFLGQTGLEREDRFPEISQFDFRITADEKYQLGYLLLNRHDGDRKMAVSELIDLDNRRVVHRWIYDVDPIWNSLENFETSLKTLAIDAGTHRFRPLHALLQRDGSIVLHGFSPLLKFDICNNLLWYQDIDIFHHAIEQDHEGNIWVPTFIESETTRGARDDYYYEDAITRVSPSGEVMLQKSLIEILEENDLDYLVYGMGPGPDHDPLHLNDIQPVLEDGKYWQKGDVFLSLRHRSMVLLYRPESNRVLWYKAGPWLHQHDVDILDETRIAVFNNNLRIAHSLKVEKVDGSNEELIYDFESDKVTPHLRESFRHLDIRTPTEGLAEFGSNGELFVEETDYGRLVQVDADGKMLWQYVNRASDGKVYSVSWSRPVTRAFGDQIRHQVEKSSCGQ